MMMEELKCISAEVVVSVILTLTREICSPPAQVSNKKADIENYPKTHPIVLFLL